MHKFVLLDRDITESSDASLPALASSTLFGKSVFTTIAIHDRTPFLFTKHLRRLRDNAESLGIDITLLHESDVHDGLHRVIRANDVRAGRARVTIFDASATSLWPYDAQQPTRLLITTADLRDFPSVLRIGISSHKINSTSPLAGIKSGNYLEKILALGESRAQGFEESIQVNEHDEVASACMANVFWLKDGSMFTPSLKTGCLAGTTRAFVMENLECEEVEVPVDELSNADQIFLTSAGMGVAQVADLNGRKLDRADHPVMHLLPTK